MADRLDKIGGGRALAGTNKLEILLFSLGADERSGRRETFGVNVFKVREVMRAPAVTTVPEMPAAVEGMVSLRGKLVPVMDLAKYAGVQTGNKPQLMIVTEYNMHVQGFLVEAVDTILRLDWSAMKVPPAMLNDQMGGLVTAVTELPDKRLVMMVDMEKILAETTNYVDTHIFDAIRPVEEAEDKPYTVYYADDSSTARKQVEMILNALSVNGRSANNGKQAWEELQQIASEAAVRGESVKDTIQLVLTDVEMPEMDGYVLTKLIKSDLRFAGIPVLMYSSLSSVNELFGQSMGVDAYVSKMQPQTLAETITRYLKHEAGQLATA
ncbi:MAG: chemotaxis protein [Sulfuricellaceae bacterium]